MKIIKYPEREEWKSLLQRPTFGYADIRESVSNIMAQTRLKGDSALVELTQKFDGWLPGDLAVSPSEFIGAENEVSTQLKTAIQIAKENIEKFHSAQREEMKIVETRPGIQCWRRSLPIETVGLYIPGGTAPLFSTLLMLGIPAKIAGCKEIIVCSPAKNGLIHPALLYTARLLGISTFYKVGGAQAIAAMAYGTQTIPAVNKIFGPGNRYVTTAKQLLSAEGIAIDMPAGPSELAVFADESCHPAFVAADLLSQAEHGMDSQVLLVSKRSEVISAVLSEIERQRVALDRTKEIDSSLSNSKGIVLKTSDDCFDLLNQYAPEHLIIASDDAAELAGRVRNAGSVFLGNYTPESAGDYISGTNHTLPTNGFAKAFSGVSLDSFVKKITFQQITVDGLKSVAPAIEVMADTEGLTAHKNAVAIRFK